MQSLWMLVASFMFALMGAGAKMSSELGVSLGPTVFARGLPSVVCVFLWAMLTHRSLKTKHLRPHLLRNLYGTAALTCVFYCYSVLPLAIATTLNFTSALFVGLWAFLKSSEGQRDWLRFLSCVVGFISVVLILRPSLSGEELHAVFLGMMSGIFAAAAMVQVRTLGQLGEPPWLVVFYFSNMVCVAGLILYAFDNTSIQSYSLPAWLALLFVGLTGFLGQLCLTQAYGAGSPILAAVLQYMTIVFSVILSHIIWKEQGDFLSYLGVVGVISAGAISAWATSRKKQPTALAPLKSG